MNDVTKRSLGRNALAAALVTLVVVGLRGGYTAADPRHFLMAWADGFTLSAALLLALAFLAWSGRMGTMDAVSFGWSRLTKKKDEQTDQPYTSYFEYLQAKQEARKSLPSLRPRFAVGCVTLVLALALNTLYAVLY